MQIPSVIILILNILYIILCPIIAMKKGRSFVGWLFGGIFLGLIGLIIILCLPNKKY